MVQSRGQQAGDQYRLGSGTLRDITTEEEAVARTVCSGNALKHTVPAPGADHSANALWGVRADKESLASRKGADSPTHVRVSARGNEC